MATKNKNEIVFQPQAGSQMDLLSSPADNVWFGGSAGGGKTFGILLDPLRHIGNKEFGAVTFRRSLSEVVNQGGLLDASYKIYPHLGANYRRGSYQWVFPSGAKISFRYLSGYDDCSKYQGTEIDCIIFDELEHFGEREYWYLFSRNRSTSGVRPYIKATMNPGEPDGWIPKFIDWWIAEDGFIIPERSGIVRWFIRVNDDIVWASDPDDLEHYKIPPKSFTFIRSSVYFNKKLLEADPGYIANLQALPYIDRMRLLEGNWKIRASAGMVMNRSWLEYVDYEDLPFNPFYLPDGTEMIRFWDFAATAADLRKPASRTKRDGPCYTVGVKICRFHGYYYVLDVIRVRLSAADTNDLVVRTAEEDGKYCKVRWEKEPGSSGIRDTYSLTNLLSRYDASGVAPEGDKLVRAKPFAAALERHRIYAVRSSWNNPWIDELHGVPDENPYWDMVDATSGAYNLLWDGLNYDEAIVLPSFVTSAY